MPETLSQRWTFNQPTPLGDVGTSWELTSESLHFRSDALAGEDVESLRWDDIAEAATAVVELPAEKGGPDMVGWMPGRMEWLLVSRANGERGLMRPLPRSEPRDAIVAALRERLGSRWVGEGLPLQSAQRRFRLSSRSDGLKVAALIGSFFVLLFLFLMVVSVVGSLLYLPGVFALGGWMFYRGLVRHRDALQVANTPTAKVSSAAMGLVELEGLALSEHPSPAGVSGRPSVWWDVGVDAWYSEGRGKGGRWRQVMARHGGSGGLVLEDATGRVPVWLRDADLLLEDQTWESGKEALPPGGVVLLAGTAFAWNGGARLRVRERRMEVGGPVYLLGTLDEARHLPAVGEERGPGLIRALRTGSWRRTVVRATPELLRPPVIALIGYLDLVTSVGRGGERAERLEDALPPALPPEAVLVWKGRAGRPFLVSNQRETSALAHLRKRSLLLVGLGVAVLCYGLYEVIKLF